MILTGSEFSSFFIQHLQLFNDNNWKKNRKGGLRVAIYHFCSLVFTFYRRLQF